MNLIINYMSVFKTKYKDRTEKRTVKFVGVHLPLSLNTYLTLFALAGDTTKSKIILNELTKWMEEMGENMCIDTLCKQLSRNAYETYQEQKKKKTLVKFLTEMEIELLRKGIPPEIVIKIRKGVRNETY